MVDKIISINDLEINEFTDIKNIVENSSQNILVFKVLRSNTLVSLSIAPISYYDTHLNKNVNRIGIKASPMVLKKLSIS